MQGIYYDKDIVMNHLANPVFKVVGNACDEISRECYVVGGYVRDIFLHRHSKDIDFVTVGSGIEVAEKVASTLGKKASIAVFRNFGTAQVKFRGLELEFVGARKESYTHDSRNPIVEDGTLDDDQKRRDFTINAMALCVNNERFGELLDPFDGIGDLNRKLIRTPLDPDVTFSDDPLRMMRAIRFATQLGFEIYPETFAAIERNKQRISIISHERITDELTKIIKADKPSRGFALLDKCGLLEIIFPELFALKGIEIVNGRGHKDNFYHTLQVLDNVAEKSDNVWLRWAALLHDIAKPVTKRYDPRLGWTFHNHNFIGEKMIPRIFKRMRLPLNEKMKYVGKLVGLHMRPIALVEDEVTDSAVRRLLFDAGDDIDDLMLLCNADITSKNKEKVKRFSENFALVRRKLVELEEKDRVRNFQPPVTGEEIMSTFNLQPCAIVGKIKEAIKNAILDGKIANNHEEAHEYMMKVAASLGLEAELITTPTESSEKEDVCGEACELMQSPIGDIILAANEEGLTECQFVDCIKTSVKSSSGNKFTAQAARELKEYFEGKRKEFTVPVAFEGTDFQKLVWNELLKIPYGESRSYGEIASAIGKPSAMRAVGMANARNKIAIIAPCHRVIGSNGKLTGYAGGLERKKFLLELESRNK